MPTYIADEKGIWHPAKERVALKNISGKPIEVEQTSSDGKKFKQTIPVGGDYIYEGPDRAALFQWWEENGKPSAEKMREMEGNVTFGEDFRMNTEFMEQYAKFRNMFGFNNVDEYLKYIGYDQTKAHKRFEEKAQIVAVHDLPARVPEINKGGIHTANLPGVSGGFGDPPDMPMARK